MCTRSNADWIRKWRADFFFRTHNGRRGGICNLALCTHARTHARTHGSRPNGLQHNYGSSRTTKKISRRPTVRSPRSAADALLLRSLEKPSTIPHSIYFCLLSAIFYTTTLHIPYSPHRNRINIPPLATPPAPSFRPPLQDFPTIIHSFFICTRKNHTFFERWCDLGSSCLFLLQGKRKKNHFLIPMKNCRPSLFHAILSNISKRVKDHPASFSRIFLRNSAYESRFGGFL